MLTIETLKAQIQKPVQEVYDFICDARNLGKILPEQVINFKGDENMCVFEVAGLAKLGLEVENRIPPDIIIFKNTEKTPVKFTLKISVLNTSNGHCSAQLIFNGDVNPMMKMMLEKPLNNLFTSMANKLENVMNGN